MRATWSTTNRRPCGPKRITMPSWPSSSASPRDSCDSEPLQSGSVSPEPGGRNDGGIDVDEAARRVLAEHVAAARPSRATREPFSPDASRRCSPPEAPDRTGASDESGRPGSNRRRPAWEAFWALAGQGFFGGGSRNGITQYCADRREFRYTGGRSPCRVLSSSSPPQQIPLAERPQKQERDGDDCVVADPGRPSSHA